MLEIEDLVVDLPRRAADAVLSVTAGKSRTLRRTLARRLGAPAGSPGSLVAEPVLEGAHPWLQHPGGWDALPTGLHPDATQTLKSRMGYRPYAHQVQTWALAASPEPVSVIISSGTGSGKTECFLGALLNHLLNASDGGASTLTGVRGLMLYPLNALISSQQERLTSWLAPFGGKLRYCLYNGLTPEGPSAESDRRKSPEQVLDRKALRANPPPLLVTNLTMLEYMLVRRQDAPILQQSQGLLEYVVLDEVHTYIGAQATELALLLRRVALAFGRDPRTIRVIATSATLGTGERRDQETQLRQFLRDLTGAEAENVHAIIGERAPLHLPTQKTVSHVDLPELQRLSDADAWDQLAPRRQLQEATRRLHGGERMRWSDWHRVARDTLGPGVSLDEGARALLAACARARCASDGTVLLPARVHIFERTLSGLWTCCDPACRERPTDDPVDWRFGKIFLDHRDSCDACGAPVLEIRVCQACGSEILAAEEVDSGDRRSLRLRAPMPEAADDDFSLDVEVPDSGEDTQPQAAPEPALRNARWVLPTSSPGAVRLAVRRRTCEILDAPKPDTLLLFAQDADFGGPCPTCGETGHKYPIIRPFRVGAPFILGTGVPIALGAVTSDPRASGKPSSGRKLLTFTDARQGTARLAAKLQADAERAFLRAFVYHAVQAKPPAAPDQDIEKQRAAVVALELTNSPALLEILIKARAELAKLEGVAEPSPIPWTAMRDRLAQDATLLHIKSLWELREDDFNRPGDLAHFLLLREFLRRAVRGNSAETMGLARLLLPQHHRSAEPPPPARTLGLSADDWYDLLVLIVTHFLRLNTIVSVPPSSFNWIDRRPTHVAVGQFDPRSATSDPWPAARGAARPSRIVSLLAQAAGVSLDDRRARDLVNEAFDAARQSLLRYLEPSQGGGFRLDLQKLALGKIKTAWICPITGRILDTTLKGLSPYPRDGRHFVAAPVALPDHPHPFLAQPSGSGSAIQEIEEFLASDPEVTALRETGIWTEFHDRAALFMPYFRSAEHSAQQPPQRLRSYEDMFKNGDINVLNCSTTMEMGVDIGAIELVVNSNVPPSIASYRQRVGRAGRRDQAIAAGLTICKERPLDRRAFDNPAKYLDADLSPPRVKLDSPAIARRHAHAYLLSAFLKSRADDALQARIGDFLGFEVPTEVVPPWQDFLHWCDNTPARLADHGEALAKVLYGTPLKPDRALFEDARDALTRVADERNAEWRALSEQEAGVAADNKPALNAIRFQKRRASEAYLLSELAAEGFLPGYGFPTGIVPLVTDSASRRNRIEERREDAHARSRDYPSRQLDIALFEYAPGTTLVLDGLVYASAGITLNWHSPATADGVREIQALRTAWRCHACGAAGVTSTAARPDACAMCGSTNLDCRDHIAPKGFAVDIRDMPNDDTLQVSHSPRNLPWVHASGADWLALPNGGRVRASPHGIIYISNSGDDGYGYAVCLQCGRAAAETEEAALGRPLPRGLNNQGSHRPLRGAPKDENGLCPGSPGSFSIKRNLQLGHSIRTAVVEVQLYDCRNPDTARAIAVALREACAIELGVEPDEMGFAATAALTPEKSQSYCSVVYDRASGGAGFASTIADDPIRYLKAARDLLDCAAPGGCGDPQSELFCARCLLSSDTQHVVDRCDRLAAFQLLDELIPQLEIAPEDRLFSTNTELETIPLAVALSRRISQAPSQTLVLWLNGGPEKWEFDEWPARTLAETWGPRGTQIRFVVRLDALRAADQSARHSLARLVQRCQAAELVEWNVPPHDATPLAALLDDSRSLFWVSRDELAGETGAGWGRSPVAPVVRGPAGGALFGASVNLSSLLMLPPATAVVDIGSEADGAAVGFGLRLRRVLETQAGELFRSTADGSLKEIIYTDRYVFSPLAALLVAELTGAFALRTRAKVIVRTRSASRSVHAAPPWQVQHDWTTQADRLAVLHGLLSRNSDGPRVNFDDTTPHRRTLVLRWEHTGLEITFDQGMGPWLPAERCRFDFGKPADGQVLALLKQPLRLRIDASTFAVIRRITAPAITH